ncbi:hypothetical protein [Frankia sp. Cr2]|uniref:hypothetical protein n=1 Tax=Frankia sp. Cr2 TaxID=3073932 RepID=UPI002AD361E0|nr:hypothetical protein [Frankia sp. Cr2]
MNSSIDQALGTPAADPAILGDDRLPGDGNDSHADQARNGQLDDQANRVEAAGQEGSPSGRWRRS